MTAIEEVTACIGESLPAPSEIDDGRFPVENLPYKHQIKMACSFLFNYEECRKSGRTREQSLATLEEEFPFAFAPQVEADLVSLAEKWLQQKSGDWFPIF
jgi:hypothetical protein